MPGTKALSSLLLIAVAVCAAACASGPATIDPAVPATIPLSPADTMSTAQTLASEQRYGDAIDTLTELMTSGPLTAQEAADARLMRAELYLQSPDCMVDMATDDMAYALDTGALPPDRAQAAKLAMDDIVSQGATACSVNLTTPRYGAGPVFDRACYARLNGYGAIKLRFDVDNAGMPNNISVRETTDDCMTEPSVLALSQMRFEPHVYNGELLAREGVEVLFRAGDPPR